jgi:hypothetical protein
MLRRPSALCAIPREEGCSSTAFGRVMPITTTVWNNLVDRGSVSVPMVYFPAVP